MQDDKPVKKVATRIVHVITSLAPGGAERTLRNLTLGSSRFEHIVICLQETGHFGPELESQGIHVISLGLNSANSPLKAVAQLTRQMRQLQPDLVQTWMYHSDLLGGIAARLASVKYLVWNVRKSQLQPDLARKRTVHLAGILGLLSALLPNRIISCSLFAGVNHARDFGYKADKFVYIANGIEPNFFSRTGKEREYRNKSWGNCGPLRVGLVARFHPQKGHVALIEALEVLCREGVPFEAFFVGSGNSASNPILQELLDSKKSAESIQLVGTQNDLPRWYESFDVLVMPSYGGEGFPNVLVESMACGTPCIASDVGESANIVGNTGFIVPPGDHLAIAQSLKQVATSDAETYVKLRRAAKRRAKAEFSLSKMIENYESTYSSLLGSE